MALHPGAKPVKCGEGAESDLTGSFQASEALLQICGRLLLSMGLHLQLGQARFRLLQLLPGSPQIPSGCGHPLPCCSHSLLHTI